MSVVITGIGNTAGAVMVTSSGGLGVTPRTRVTVTSGTTINHLENASGTPHCCKNVDGERLGGVTHHSVDGSGSKKGRKKSGWASVASPVRPRASVLPGTGNTS